MARDICQRNHSWWHHLGVLAHPHATPFRNRGGGTTLLAKSSDSSNPRPGKVDLGVAEEDAVPPCRAIRILTTPPSLAWKRYGVKTQAKEEEEKKKGKIKKGPQS